MRKYVLALDLFDDPNVFSEYDAYHRAVWPEIKDSLFASGIQKMSIYRYGNRLIMLMEVDDTFSFERKATMDAENPKVQEWETLMWKYQQALPGAKPGQKWVVMEEVFAL